MQIQRLGALRELSYNTYGAGHACWTLSNARCSSNRCLWSASFREWRSSIFLLTNQLTKAGSSQAALLPAQQNMSVCVHSFQVHTLLLVMFNTHGMILGRSDVSTTIRMYAASSLTKPPLKRCSIRMNIGQPEAMFISLLLPGRWNELECGSGRKWSVTCFFPVWFSNVSVTFCLKGQGSRGSYGPLMMTKKKLKCVFLPRPSPLR